MNISCSRTPKLIARVLRSSRSHGLSLVEVLISTAILASLMVATGGAWVASTNAIEVNDAMSQASQSARIGLGQMLCEIRRCHSLQAFSDHIDLISFDNHQFTYQYSSTQQQLQMINNDSAPVTHVLARNVTAASFAADMAPDPDTQALVAVHVSVNVTIRLKGNVVALSGSAAPRVNVHY